LRQAIPEWFAHAAPQPYLTERPTISTEAILALGVLAVGKFPGKDGIKSCQSCWERMKGSFLEVKQQKPLKMALPKRKGSSSNHHFSGAMVNFGGEHLLE